MLCRRTRMVGHGNQTAFPLPVTSQAMIRFLFATGVLLASCTFANAQDLSGDWSGTWHSDANNHRGRINATFQQLDSNTVRANFRGTFAKIIPFRYSTNLCVASQQPGLTVLSGSKKIPLGGQFRYYVEMTDSCFNGSFSSRRNRGTFVMAR